MKRKTIWTERQVQRENNVKRHRETMAVFNVRREALRSY